METLMNKRLRLQSLFKTLTNNVYFQPTSNIQMNYPAIKFSLNDIDKKSANNETYFRNVSFKVTVIDEDPDSELKEQILNMPLCEFNTHYVSNNLNHDVFTLYY